jgi:fumarate reductase subunit C
MAQELTSVFVAIYALILLWGLGSLAGGEAAWQSFLTGLGSPFLLVVQWLVLVASLYHTVSWFAVTPKAMPVRVGDEQVPGHLIAGGHYVAWLIVSFIILYVAGVV